MLLVNLKRYDQHGNMSTMEKPKSVIIVGESNTFNFKTRTDLIKVPELAVLRVLHV